MDKMFPRTTVGGMSLSRMIIGTNWLAGWSHRSVAADERIRAHHAHHESIDPMLETFLRHGVDTIMAPFAQTPPILESVRHTEEMLQKKMILIDTPIINVDDTPQARREAEQTIRKSKELGASFCLIHHSSAEQLVDKNKQKIHRLDDYTKMIRDAGMIPGLSAHMPELIVYSDQNGYDVETYIQIYNCMGFLMQVEIETVNSIIWNAKKPVMTIKSMAAGRCTPFVGLNFSWATLRDCDMVTVGCFEEREALEDIEISMAALERRAARLDLRRSPNQNQAAFG
ncbi:MAG TPA: hypothetical protein H9671_02550 [Firmicutes bacterium]|nr:hypothetical protein [Bacillota bacterium]